MNFKEIWMEFRKKCWPTVCGKWLTMVLFIDMIITNCLQELSMDWQNLDERCYRLLMRSQFLGIITNQFLNNKKTDFIWDNRIDNFRFIGQKTRINPSVVTTPISTTFLLLTVASICPVLPYFGFSWQSQRQNNLSDILGKSGQIRAKLSILGGTWKMIKILFVCHGNSISVKDVSPFDWVNRGKSWL